MTYKEDPKFTELKDRFQFLSNEVNKLRSLYSKNTTNVMVIDMLILSLVTFDDHMKLMVSNFPDYYVDSKQMIDKMFEANDNYIKALNNQKLGMVSYGSN